MASSWRCTLSGLALTIIGLVHIKGAAQRVFLYSTNSTPCFGDTVDLICYYPDVMERVNEQPRYTNSVPTLRMNGTHISSNDVFNLSFRNQTTSRFRVRIDPVIFTGDTVSFSCTLPLTAGGEDSNSTVVDAQDTAAPPIPNNVTVNGTTVTLKWKHTDKGPCFTNFTFYYNITWYPVLGGVTQRRVGQSGVTGPGATEYIITNLMNFTDYPVELFAFTSSDPVVYSEVATVNFTTEGAIFLSACNGRAEPMCCSVSGCKELVCLSLTNPVHGFREHPQFRGSGTDTSVFTTLQFVTGDVNATIEVAAEGFRLWFRLNMFSSRSFFIQARVWPVTEEPLFSNNYTIYQRSSPPRPTVKSAALSGNANSLKLNVKIQKPRPVPGDACLNWTYHAYLNGSMLKFLEQRVEDASLVLVFEVEDRDLISQLCVEILAVGDTGLQSNSTCVTVQVESGDTGSYDWIAGVVLVPVGCVIALVVVVVVVIVCYWYCHNTHKKTTEIHKLNEVWKSAATSLDNSVVSTDTEVIPLPLATDVTKLTRDEVRLQQLCYMATGIKQLLVGPDGGTFIMGSGDASLEFPPGAVEKKISIRYAIILHGPFEFPAGDMLGSVVVYLNMDGATLVKPIQLFLSHWCSREESIDEDTLTFATAPHTLHTKQQCYELEEQKEADFITHADIGILKISKPRCLHCVKGRIGKIARYRAVTFSQYFPANDTLFYRIQFMCDSNEWDQSLTEALRQTGWDKTSLDDTVTRFESSKKDLIAARPTEREGRGWIARVSGMSEVKFKDFQFPNRKSKLEIDKAVNSGQYPLCILYEIIFTVPKEQRVKPAVLTVSLQGEQLNLQFNCRIMEELPLPVFPATFEHGTGAATSPSLMETAPVNATGATPPVSPAFSKPVSAAAMLPSSKEAAQFNTKAIITTLKHRLDAKWKEFGMFLGVEDWLIAAIDTGRKPEDCMLELVKKWMSKETGTGTLPRTWHTVVKAVKDTGVGVLAEDLEHQHGVHL